MAFFGALERVVIRFYPYRVPIAVLALVVLAAVGWLVLRRGWHRPVVRLVSSHRLASAVTALVLLAVALPLGNYLLSPLWQRVELHEASPIAAPSTAVAAASSSPVRSPEAGMPSATSSPLLVARGMFTGADDFHFGRGDALLIETAPQRHTLRFENFSIRNGPSLFVYLSDSPKGYGGTVLKLGPLRATDGAFNYEVPEGVDISKFKSAIVWCEQFSVLFATAPLG